PRGSGSRRVVAQTRSHPPPRLDEIKQPARAQYSVRLGCDARERSALVWGGPRLRAYVRCHVPVGLSGGWVAMSLPSTLVRWAWLGRLAPHAVGSRGIRARASE